MSHHHSTSSRRLHGLDHLRAFAIIFVVLYHYGRLFPSPEWITSIGEFGWTGVDLFFVLSGYLIAAQLFAKMATGTPISFSAFFIRRFFRIIPVYWIVVAVYFLLPSFREREAPAPLWKYLTFTQNLGLDLRSQGTFSHAWSLCIEEQFYLLLPLILIILARSLTAKKGWVLLFVLFLAGFSARIYSWYELVAPFAEGNFWIYWYKWIYYPTYCRLDGLLIGVAIAAIFQFKPVWREKIQKRGNLFLLAGILMLAIAYFVCQQEGTFIASVFGFPLVDSSYGLIVIGAICPGSFLYNVKSVITARIAVLSYVVYLTHKIVIHLTQEQISKLHIEKNSNVMFLSCMGVALLVGYLLNIVIEKPLVRLRDRVLSCIDG